MMTIDIIALLINQRHLSRCIMRLETIDRKLAQENIKIDYKSLRHISYGLVIGASLRKYLMVLFAFFIFSTSLWNVFCVYLPIYISTLSKVWFVMLLCNIRMKFHAMNNYLEILGVNLSSLKRRVEHVSESHRTNVEKSNVSPIMIDEVTYLHKEIKPKAHRVFRFNARSDIVPMVQRKSNGWLGHDTGFIDGVRKSEFVDYTAYQSTVHMAGTHQKLHIADRFDLKLTKLCYWHDEICEIGKIVNVLFSFQMLVLMAYAFLSITAQFYFVYCGLVQQTVPMPFKSAENISISVVYFASTAFCCVYIIYICWQTKNASNQMGIFLHKVANIVDENHLYETVCVHCANRIAYDHDLLIEIFFFFLFSIFTFR